ncbi:MULTISPECIES: hypothetical protein [Arthrobacter]|uniref:Uncharacterized protein n=1 Tax=Arthrobacter terricola TaxID=2547396 RepID=A0A4R5K9E6_9MICC|nr:MULTISPECIES: hypothetical protein [Arthrobacter]MBT8163021.1 hypothetical protein [Arthrobacter sp. GN70]TDF91773.1 hypothetical protein E1809_19845 [Arthrobacter terricola]
MDAGRLATISVTGASGLTVGILGMLAAQVEQRSAEPGWTGDLLEDLLRCWRSEDPLTPRILLRHRATLRRLSAQDAGNAFHPGRRARMTGPFEDAVQSMLGYRYEVKAHRFASWRTWGLAAPLLKSRNPMIWLLSLPLGASVLLTPYVAREAHEPVNTLFAAASLVAVGAGATCFSMWAWLAAGLRRYCIFKTRQERCNSLISDLSERLQSSTPVQSQSLRQSPWRSRLTSILTPRS